MISIVFFKPKSEEIGLDVDVAAHCLGVRADIMGGVDDVVRNVAVETIQANVQAGTQEIGAVVDVEIDLGIDLRPAGSFTLRCSAASSIAPR